MIMYKTLGISDEVVKLVEEAEKDCREEFLKIDNNSYINDSIIRVDGGKFNG